MKVLYIEADNTHDWPTFAGVYLTEGDLVEVEELANEIFTWSALEKKCPDDSRRPTLRGSGVDVEHVRVELSRPYGGKWLDRDFETINDDGDSINSPVFIDSAAREGADLPLVDILSAIPNGTGDHPSQGWLDCVEFLPGAAGLSVRFIGRTKYGEDEDECTTYSYLLSTLLEAVQ